MKEYIEREAIEYPYMTMTLWGLNQSTCHAYNEGVKAVQDTIAAMTSADVVEAKRGRWIEHDCFKCNSNGDPVIKTGTVFVCSECGREERYREPFCHCGANMREGDK